MKKKFAILLALFLIAVVCSAGCIDPEDPVDPIDPVDPVDPVDPITPVDPVDPVVPTEEYSVMFMLNYGDAGAYTAETVKAGETVSKPASPTRSGYTFNGWFTAAEGGAAYDFTQPVNADVTLYAQWKKKSSSSSGGHSHSYSWNVVKAANCTVDGQGQYVCSCGQVKSTETIPATGHLETEEVVNAVGDTEVKCKACGLVLVTIPASNELEIRTVEDLKAFADTVNAGTDYAGKTVKLVYDLNLQNEEWIPIGSSGNLFAGTFEGNGKTILNLKITGTEDVGFFGVLYGTVKNLNLDGVTITGNKNLGAIVGYGKGGSVEGCTVTNAEITAIPNAYESSFDNGDDVGGIVGFCYNGNDGDFDVSGCTVSDSTLTAFRDVGGIVGSANGDDVSGNSISNVDIIVDKVTNKYDRADINGAAVVGRVLSGELVAQGTVDDWTVTIIYADGFWKVTDATSSVYEISSVDGLKYFRDTVNAGETYSGKTVKLTDDLDLGNEEWTPIGTSEKKFNGVFDGQDKTISNLKINAPNTDSVGFFGYVQSGNIKSLKINNALVTGGDCTGVVVGHQYTSGTMSDIELTGLVQVNGKHYVGGVAGKTDYTSISDVIINVDAGSYVMSAGTGMDGSVKEHNVVGGVTGYLTEGSYSITNADSNIAVSGDSYRVGGIVGFVHERNSLTNCKSSGVVTITGADDESHVKQIGGIAGAWFNGQNTVTLTGCEFTGTLSATVNGEMFTDFLYDGLVGAQRSASGSGKLIIDGVTYLSTVTVTAASSEALKGALDAVSDGEVATINLPADTYTFPATSFKEGVTLVCEEGTVFAGTSSLNIKGATVVGATFENGGSYAVSGTIYGIFKDCVFDSSEALRWCYSSDGNDIVFENCEIRTDFRGFHFDTMSGNVTFKNCSINGFNAYGGPGTMTFDGCTFGYDESMYNGLNIYSNTTLIDCTFTYLSGKTNFIDMEGIGKTLTITNCTATLDGASASIINFVGGSKLDQNTVIVDGVLL